MVNSNKSNGKKTPAKKRPATNKKAGTKKKSVAKKKAASKKTSPVKKAVTGKKAANKKKPQKTHVSPLSRRVKLLKIVVVLGLLGGGYLIYLDAVIQSKFEGKRWQIPAKVFSRPLEMFAGANISAEQIVFELQQLNYQRKTDTTGMRPGSYYVSGDEIKLHTRGFDFWDGTEPAAHVSIRLSDNSIQNLTVNGKGYEIARLEPLLIGGIYPAHNEDRILVNLDQVPSALIDALLAVEDRGFYEHWV